MPPFQKDQNDPRDQDLAAVMPELESPQYGYCHTVDSAFLSLLALGLDPDRITIRRAGRGWNGRRVVAQEPRAHSSIHPHDDVVLSAAGDGLFERLPTGFRDRGTDAGAGVDTLLEVFDDPAEKAGCYVRQGGFYFDLRPGNPSACARWIRAFGIKPEDWPVESWYPLARFVPILHKLSGQEAGIRLGMKLLLGLDVVRMTWHWERTALSDRALTRLGGASTRLGVDFIAGPTLEDEAMLKIVLGPLTLREYRHYQTEEMRRRLELVLNLVVPCHLVRSVGWVVGKPEFRPRLADPEDNAVLGINMHLGKRVQ